MSEFVLDRRGFLSQGAALGVGFAARGGPSGADDRAYWLAVMRKIADPILRSLSEARLKALMPVETAAQGKVADRAQFTHLEALGRLLAGMAPWLESGSETELREQYGALARQALANAVNPQSADYMNFSKGAQPVVDAAFLALGILRAPQTLWGKLDASVKANVMEAMRSSRVIRPGYNNWLLFSATVEAFLCMAGEPWDAMRVDYAIREHENWYKGDGLYGDGPQFHWDYYNSFVIHPMLLTVMETTAKQANHWDSFHSPAVLRAQRYAAIQERLIAPDGSFPAIGRSLAYRFGAFHLLAMMAWREQLPETLTPAQVRCALTAVMKRMLEAPGTFDEKGFLRIGFCGHQPAVGEGYISTGSLYLCAAGLLPLGLPESGMFWSAPPAEWTSQKIWGGQDLAADHAI